MSEKRLIDELRDLVTLVPLVYGHSREARIAEVRFLEGLLWLDKGIEIGSIRLPPDTADTQSGGAK